MTNAIIHQNCDYVTVVTMDVDTGKLYQVIGGELRKTPAAHNANGWAQTHYLPDAPAMGALIKEISEHTNKALILGYIRGTEPTVDFDRGVAYRLMSDKDFRAFASFNNAKLDKFASKPIEVDGVKYATRTKRMFHASTWFGFDRDVVEGMPDNLEPDAKFPRWWTMMNEMMPEIRDCSYVAVKSASCRVHYQGKPLADTNIHVYMQGKIAEDTERFGKAGMAHSFARGFGFMRDIRDRLTGKVIGQRPWTLYDPTTFSRERLFFDGAPIVDPIDPAVLSGELYVEPSKPIIFTGSNPRVNTKALSLPSQGELKDLGLEFDIDKQGRVTIVNPRDLTPDVEFEYKNTKTGDAGFMTMRQFVEGPDDRLRCQSVFRPDSNSFAAYVSKEDGCHPFMYDVGTNINYKYNDTAEAFAAVAEAAVASNADVTPKESPIPTNQVHLAASNGQIIDSIAVTVPPPPPNINEAFVAPDLSALPSLAALPEMGSLSLPNDVNNANHAQYEAILGAKHTDHALSPAYGALYGTDYSDEYAESDLANAQRFAYVYNDLFKFVPNYQKWYRWVDVRWVECDANEQRYAAHKMVTDMGRQATQLPSDHSFRKWTRTSLSSSSIGSLLKEASAISEMVLPAEALDKEWYNFGVGNGYVDLRLREGVDGVGAKLRGFQPPDRKKYMSRGNEIDYVEGAECPIWEKTILDIFSGDKELVSFFQKFAGYSMCGDPSHEVLAFFVGNGSNGKSTLTGIMERIFGDYKVTADKSVLMSKGDTNGQGATPALARLKGVRLALMTETREGDIIDESTMKALSGADTITARPLYGNNIEFAATHVSWIATNHAPQIRSVDEGTWRRIWYFHFKRNFLKEQGRKKLDTGLKHRIVSTEMSGVLNWCLEGVRRYHIEGIEPPASILAATAQYKDDMDIIADWLNACMEFGDDCEITYTQLWQSYENYSLARGDHLIKQSRTLNAKVAAKGFEKLKHVHGYNDERGFKGLRVKINIPKENSAS